MASFASPPARRDSNHSSRATAASPSGDVLLGDPASMQHLRDIKLAIEFKHMMKHAPGGVFLMPTLDDNRICHGVIFVRRGLYRNGVFRFRLVLPRTYNAINTHPQITFTPPVFNPLVNMETGVLDLRLEETLREWNPEKHFLVTAMTFLKGIFYLKSFEKFPVVANEEARKILDTDKELYLQKVERCVAESLERMYEPPEPGCLIVFTEPKPAHYNLRVKIFGADAVAAESSMDENGDNDRAPEEAETGVEGGATGTPAFATPSKFYDASNENEDDEDRYTDRLISEQAARAGREEAVSADASSPMVM